ncbi:MAG: hypothetical protein IJN23_02360 [Akkermansia sp.]|nr:hypothetical protein [Akkermansia sp.]
MSRIITLSSVMALAMSTPMLLANNAPALRPMPTGLMPMQARGNCDLMASNTVNASFVGLRDLAVQRVDQSEPTTVQVGVFQVINNLAYRRFNRIGDGQLVPGMQFTIAMNKELPGQPAENVDTISSLQPGEEVVMRVDHLYLITGQEGESIRVCARLARRNAQPAAPAATPAPLPIPGAQQPAAGGSVQYSSSSSSFSFTTGGANGPQMQTVQTSRVYDPATGQIKTRMIINGVEVDPVTRQPLAPAAAPAPAAPAAAPAPTSEEQARREAAEDENDDTIIEHNNNPVVQPGDTPIPTPETTPAPAPAPTTPEGHMDAADSF